MNTENDKEIWKPIPKHPDYEISNHGRLRRSDSLRIMRFHHNKKNYIQVNLNGMNYSVHRLVALAFLDPQPGKSIVNHIDRKRSNNHADNLEYVSQSENVIHALKTPLPKECERYDYLIRHIPRELWKRAKHRATDEGGSLREILLKALDTYLA